MEEITARFTGERMRFGNADGDVIIGSAVMVRDGESESGSDNEIDSDELTFEDEVPSHFAIKGQADQNELQVGQTYRFHGQWSSYTNKRTGQTERQFHFNSFVRATPHGRSGVIHYLKTAGKGRGIGQARATALWEAFGSDAVRVLRETPEAAGAAVPALTAEQLQAASEWLKEQHSLEGCSIELMDLLTGRGFPKTTARNAVKAWGNRASELIRRDPYKLMALRGYGFKRTDAMYLDLGLNPAKLRRQALCCWYAVASDSEGHTWYPVEHAIQGLQRMVSGADLRPVRAIAMAKRIGRLSPDHAGALATMRSNPINGAVINKGGQLWVAEGRKAWAEDRLAELICEAMQESAAWPSVDQVDGITDHQRDELRRALSGPIGILGGGPGTGKTFTAAALVKLLVEIFGQDAVVIGAPTGKAAVRITEAMVSYGIETRARTWHSILGIGRKNGLTGTFGFNHDESDPLPFSVLIGDESSMLDTSLMCSIMRARAKGALVLLVGDVNQLPPVGHGAPLRDMIAAGLPCGELREIKRNSGGIVEACAAIRDGKKWGEGDNLQIDQVGGPERQIERMLEVFEEARDAGMDPVWDCQVVCAVNAKSALSRKELNVALQEHLNLNPRVAGSPFRLHDKIVNLKNGTFPVVDAGTIEGQQAEEDEQLDGEGYVANGELAEVLSIEEKFFVARLSNPTRTIRIPRGKANDGDDGEAGGSDDDKSNTGTSWDLGYALSVHKSQGSEWPWVVVMIDEYPGAKRVCDRAWVYTAISRAKSRCVLVGKKSVSESFCKRINIGKRKTFLKELVSLKSAERILVDL